MFARFYWILPLLSALVWLGTLLGLLLYWVTIGEPRYVSMDPGQHIAFISDVGAQKLQPLFIAGGTTTVVLLDFAFIAERWLRHLGRLAPNTSRTQKVLSIISIGASIVGAAGLILLTIFDTVTYPRLHDAFLLVFILGYLVSAIFTCAEYQRLGIHFRQHAVLRASFWIKLGFILLEVALAIPFGVFQAYRIHLNVAAILEWVIALVFMFYTLSFVLDLLPAVKVRHSHEHPAAQRLELEKAQAEADHVNGNGYAANGYRENGYANGTSHF